MDTLPPSVEAYFAAKNRHDTNGMAHQFAEDAAAKDEGAERQGIAAIRQWMEETNRKYHVTVEVVTAENTDDKTVVSGLVSGNFPGSPATLRFTFTLAGEKIARLEIN